MNQKQAKQLKNGDKILIEAIFNQIDDDGDAVIKFANSVSDYECGFIATKHIVGVVVGTNPNNPNFDPCRPFKEGDEVRVLEERHGRKAPVCGAICPGEIYTVSEDEKDGDVMLRTGNCGHDCISWDWLELVTPAEELEPYFIFENSYCFEVRRKEPDDDRGTGCERDVSIFFFSHPPYTRTKEAARAAAEAECARLNAEHRKEEK